jgi:uncharacterized protein YneF (UPF0154 family)
MIKGFEDITFELTEKEMKLLPMFIKGLQTKKGKSNAITNKRIRQRLEAHGIKISDSRVRKIINHIRNNELVPLLCSTSKGYFVAANSQEVEEYLEGLKQRIQEQTRIYDSIEHQYKTYAVWN